jgi:nitrate/TMAO reductase-like tetraheme cytochrome c subunit
VGLTRQKVRGDSGCSRGGAHGTLWRRVVRAGVTLVGATTLGLALAVPASGQKATGVVQCRNCHSNRDFLVGKGTPSIPDSALYVPDSLVHDSKHAGLSCISCHPAFASGYPHRVTTAFAVPCQTCHQKEGEDWARSIHARVASTGGSAPTCTTCHGTHHILGTDDPRSPIYPLNVASLCGSCHANPKIIGTYFGAANQAQARTAVANYYKTVHGTAMTKDGLIVSATCSDCHSAHLILPPDSAASTVNRANIATTCGKCHAGVLATFDSSSHGQALLSGAKTPTGHSAPVCIDCHPAHHIVAASDPVWFRGVVQECGSCHEQQYKTYFETYHGQVTELGFGLTAKCSDCHTAHDMRPAIDPRSSVNPANLVRTCGQCHPAANANFVKYQPHGDPRNRRAYPILFWTWLFMTSLLVGVFLFFGTHTLLWLGRITLDRVRAGHGTDADPAAPTPGDTGNEAHP